MIILNSIGDKIYPYQEGDKKLFKAETLDGKTFIGLICQCKTFINGYRMFKERNWKIVNETNKSH